MHSLSCFSPTITWQEQERRENYECQRAREASSFAESKKILSQNRMTDNFSACVKCCFKKRKLETEDWLTFGTSYSQCSALFLNNVVTDSISLLILQELNSVNPCNRSLESSATSSLQHHFTGQVITVQDLCKWASTGNCLWTPHWTQPSKTLIHAIFPLNLKLPPWLKLKSRLKSSTGLGCWAQNQTLEQLNASTPEISMQRFLSLTPLLKRVAGTKLCCIFQTSKLLTGINPGYFSRFSHVVAELSASLAGAVI